MSDELPTISPTEAAILHAFNRLVKHLEKEGVLSTSAFADDLEAYADALPEQARPLYLNLVQAYRTPAQGFGVIEGGKGDER